MVSDDWDCLLQGNSAKLFLILYFGTSCSDMIFIGQSFFGNCQALLCYKPTTAHDSQCCATVNCSVCLLSTLVAAFILLCLVAISPLSFFLQLNAVCKVHAYFSGART